MPIEAAMLLTSFVTTAVMCLLIALAEYTGFLYHKEDRPEIHAANLAAVQQRMAARAHRRAHEKGARNERNRDYMSRSALRFVKIAWAALMITPVWVIPVVAAGRLPLGPAISWLSYTTAMGFLGLVQTGFIRTREKPPWFLPGTYFKFTLRGKDGEPAGFDVLEVRQEARELAFTANHRVVRHVYGYLRSEVVDDYTDPANPRPSVDGDLARIDPDGQR